MEAPPPRPSPAVSVQILCAISPQIWRRRLGKPKSPPQRIWLLSNSEPLGGQATASLVCLAPTLARVVPTRSFLSAIDGRRLSKLLLFEGFNLAPRSRQHCEIPRLKSSSKMGQKGRALPGCLSIKSPSCPTFAQWLSACWLHVHTLILPTVTSNHVVGYPENP